MTETEGKSIFVRVSEGSSYRDNNKKKKRRNGGPCVSAVSWRRQNIKEGSITWRGISIGNFVVNVDWN